MAEILFSTEAQRDVMEIGDYIAHKLHNTTSVRSLTARIVQATLSLLPFPESGTLLSFPGLTIPYRRLTCGNYLIFYHLSEESVQIDRILYRRQDYLSILFGEELESE